MLPPRLTASFRDVLGRLPVRALAVALAFGGAPLLAAGPAEADFRLCNKTPNRVGIAIGYRDHDGWATEGWWNLDANSCDTLLRGSLIARYYYIYAIDYDQGGEWAGKAIMCTQDRMFTIRGIDECSQRGYEETGFFEIDTGEQRSWTVQLTEPTVESRAQ